MGSFEELLPRQRLAGERMVGTHEAHVGIAEQRLAAHRLAEAGKKSYCEVEGPGRERIIDVFDLERDRLQANAGRDALQPIDERRKKLDLPEIGHVEPESTRRAGGIEARAMSQG